MKTRVFPLAAACVLAACGSDSGLPEGAPAVEGPPQDVWFQESAAARGLLFEHRSGHETTYRMPEIMGGGAALFDADGDGDLDAYLVQSAAFDGRGEGNRLFLNRGAGEFEDASAGSGADHRGYGMGVATGDVDEDGRVDLLVTNVGPNALLANLGAGRFEDRTPEAGVGHAGWGTSAAFFDADRDGDLDLFITNYIDWSPSAELPCFDRLSRPDYCSPKNYQAPARDLFYENRGAGTFADASRASGVHAAPGTGLGVGTADFDGDGWQDVFVANDGMPDHLWINLQGRAFEDRAMLAGCAVDTNGLHKAGMGVAIADLDDDADPDLLVCNLKGETDSLFLNEGGVFLDRTARSGVAGLSKPFTRFGLGLYDFDADGQLDLFQANGRVERPAVDVEGDPYAEPNRVFRGLGQGRFEPLDSGDGLATPRVATSRAAAFGDVDGDGLIDVLVVNRDATADLLLSVSRPTARPTLLSVLERSGRPALGARVSFELEGRRLLRRVHSDGSYQAASDPRIHLVRPAEGGVGEVTVTWADGAVEVFGPLGDVPRAELRRGQGRAR